MKRLLATILCFFVLFLFYGCNNSESTNVNPEEDKIVQNEHVQTSNSGQASNTQMDKQTNSEIPEKDTIEQEHLVNDNNSNSSIRSAYTDGSIILELYHYNNDEYWVCLFDMFHDDFYSVKADGNIITLERIISTACMPEAESPYDENTFIYLTLGKKSPDGEFSYDSISYHRDTELYFYNTSYSEDGTPTDPYYNETIDSLLVRDDSVSNSHFHDRTKSAHNLDENSTKDLPDEKTDVLTSDHPMIGMWKAIDGTGLLITDNHYTVYSPWNTEPVLDKEYTLPSYSGYSEFFDIYENSDMSQSYWICDNIYYDDFDNNSCEYIGNDSVMIAQRNVLQPDYMLHNEPLPGFQTFIRVNSMDELLKIEESTLNPEEQQIADTLQGTWNTEYYDIQDKVVITKNTLEYSYITNIQEVSKENFSDYIYSTYSVDYRILSIYKDIGKDIEIEILCSNNEYRILTLRDDSLLCQHEGMFALKKTPQTKSYQDYLDYIKTLPG